MVRPRLVVLVLIGLLSAAGPGASPAQMPVAANYTIGPKDVLVVTIFGEPDLTGKSYTVDADGMFSFPMVGRVQAAGLTVMELEAALRKRLVPDYFRNPQIAINIDQYASKQIIVSGEVARPGPQPFTGGMTLLGVLARAGGAMPTASGEVLVARVPRVAPAADDPQIESIRVDLVKLQAGALELDIEVRDGDTILVPRAEAAYVLGEVKNPGAYPVQRNTTVQQMLSLAGGMTPEAAQGRITIDRDGKTLKDVKLTDLVRPGDTLKLPARFF